MTQSHYGSEGRPIGPSIDLLVTEALDAVRRGRLEPTKPHANDPATDLMQAFISDTPDDHRDALSRLLDKGVTSRQFINNHVPQTARRLGELWANNQISFVEVTIGAARLQESVRKLSSRNIEPSAGIKGPRILLTAPEAEQHLIGLFVIAENLRQLGCQTTLAIGESAKKVTARTTPGTFDMIGVTMSSNRMIPSAISLIGEIKAASRKTVPVVVGGEDLIGVSNLADVTGANFGAQSAQEALNICNIKLTK